MFVNSNLVSTEVHNNLKDFYKFLDIVSTYMSILRDIQKYNV